MKYMPNVRKATTPRFAVLLAVALVGTGWAATAYRRRKTHGVTTVDRQTLRPRES